MSITCGYNLLLNCGSLNVGMFKPLSRFKEQQEGVDISPKIGETNILCVYLAKFMTFGTSIDTHIVGASPLQ